MANRLKDQKSIYLQQHANNPVNWLAWGPEAFAQAKRENKPLLISIGYSTCHWCHVMEHESFEDPQVAALLNANFVAIKVDREEHPDVDEFYMDAVQALTRRGGWPLNMFTTPELKPFFGGTYFQKSVFLDLLTKVDALWKSDSAQVRAQADQLVAHVSAGNVLDLKVEASKLGAFREKFAGWREKLIEIELHEHDPVWGGFGAAPKFPRSHALSALLRAALASKDPARTSSAYAAVDQTLKGMAYGGMRDHLRGGFHRYSTDERWLVPHFEKMLYDQALLIQSYSEGYRVYREDFFADIVEETVDYLEAEMRLPEGGFAAAQDADSEGVEGKFYVWQKTEIEEAFKDETAELVGRFLDLHSVTEKGNWEAEERNVLATKLEVPWSSWAEPEMRRLRQKLLKLRASRVAPVRDPKMIVSWNAWLAAGMLQASLHLLDRPALSKKLLQSAERTIVYLMNVAGKERELPRIVYGREHKGSGYFEDYATMAAALQWLGFRKCDSAPLALANEFIERIEKLFRDPEGKLRSRRLDQPSELPNARLEFHDGATPAPLSVWVGVLLRQGLATSEPHFLEQALTDVAPLEKVLDQYPVALTHLLSEMAPVNGSVAKIPKGKEDEFLKEWTSRVKFAGETLFQPSLNAEFQACDFESCFYSGANFDFSAADGNSGSKG